MYKVIILNDDYTPMEFVVHVLERFFGMNREKATQIMLTIHTSGSAVVGIFPREDRKSTRLNSSHRTISYAVFCLKKKKTQNLHEKRFVFRAGRSRAQPRGESEEQQHRHVSHGATSFQ